MQFFESLGVPLKIERGQRVFPVSDKSSDIIRALAQECERKRVHVCFHHTVRRLIITDKRIEGVVLADGKKMTADKVIVATGGRTYSSTGSSGDGYDMAGRCGHTIQPIRAGLTGWVSSSGMGKQLQGLTLKNIRIRITTADNTKKSLYEGFGELLFTHYGVSGPLMLTASSLLGDRLREQPLLLHIDLKPALSREKLDRRLVDDFSAAMNSGIKNACRHLLPKSMLDAVLQRAEIDSQMKINQITKNTRLKLVDTIKDYTLPLEQLRDIEEAIVTRGGVDVTQVDSSTMESKLISGLFFAGEVLDLDALTGGFNLQIAWSTGYLAGMEL